MGQRMAIIQSAIFRLYFTSGAVQRAHDLSALRRKEGEGVVGKRENVEREGDLGRAVVLQHRLDRRPCAAAVGALRSKGPGGSGDC